METRSVEEVCLVCANEVQPARLRDDHYDYSCTKCRSRYALSGTSVALLERNQAYASNLHKIAGHIFHENKLNNAPSIKEERSIRAICDRPAPGLADKAQLLLLELYSRVSIADLDRDIEFDRDPLLPACIYAKESHEARIVAQLLEKKEFFKSSREIGVYRGCLTHEGIIEAESLMHKVVGLPQGFVAMWFDPSTTDVYEHALSKGINQAGYVPLRVDRTEHNNKIDDEIIAHIRRSRFVVADFTGHRWSVYYEAGFAHGLGIEVIATCRGDQMEKLAFDIRQYNCIPWKEEELEDFANRLQLRIEAVLGDGPKKVGP